MRSDMSEVVIECYRSNSKVKYREIRQLVSKMDFGNKAPMRLFKRLNYYGTREQSDNLSPLRRFLEKACGRFWDDVYSEVVKGLPSGTMGEHIRGHVFDFVQVKPDPGFRVPFYQRFFVDDEGILRKNLDHYHYSGRIKVKREKKKPKLFRYKGSWYFKGGSEIYLVKSFGVYPMKRGYMAVTHFFKNYYIETRWEEAVYDAIFGRISHIDAIRLYGPICEIDKPGYRARGKVFFVEEAQKLTRKQMKKIFGGLPKLKGHRVIGKSKAKNFGAFRPSPSHNYW